MKNIGIVASAIMALAGHGGKPQRIVGYYNPNEGKPQGRNEPCRCRSGKKFKHCCINKPKDK